MTASAVAMDGFTGFEIADAADVPQPTASREVRRLEQAGVVQVHGGRNQRSVRVDRTAVLYPELAGLVLKAFGPQVVLAELLSAVGSIDYAAVSAAGPSATPGRRAAHRRTWTFSYRSGFLDAVRAGPRVDVVGADVS